MLKTSFIYFYINILSSTDSSKKDEGGKISKGIFVPCSSKKNKNLEFWYHRTLCAIKMFYAVYFQNQDWISLRKWARMQAA